MKTLDLKCKNVLSILTLILFTSLPAFATGIDIGTQFGISHIVPEDERDTTTYTFTRLPSGSLFDIGSPPTSLYAMLYPHKHIGIGPEFSYGVTSISISYEQFEGNIDRLSTLHLGAKLALYLMDYRLSSPYLNGRISRTSYSGDSDNFFISDESEHITGIGIGAGYQFVIKPAFVLRLEAQMNRLVIDDENAIGYGLMISIGTRLIQ